MNKYVLGREEKVGFLVLEFDPEGYEYVVIARTPSYHEANKIVEALNREDDPRRVSWDEIAR